MTDSYAQTVEMVKLAVARVASAPEDEQRYLDLNFAIDRAVERDLRYRELLALFRDGAETAPPESAWAWRLAAGLSANLMGDAPAAVDWLSQALGALRAVGKEETAAASFVLGELSRAYYHLGDHRAGLEAANRALQLAHAVNSMQAAAFAHHYLGLLSLRRRDYDYALRHITAARDLFERMGQRRGRARVLDSLATLEMELGHYDSARRLLEESLAVKEELNDLRGLALTCGNLARLYTALGDYPKALHFLDRERTLTARVGDERNATLMRVQLGELHLRHGHPSMAADVLLMARALAQRRNDARLEAYACFVQAEAERQLGNLHAATEAIERAYDYFSASDDPLLRDRCALRRALIRGCDLASPEVQEPLQRLREANAPAQLAEALFETASFFREQGRVEEAVPLFAEALDVAEPTQADQWAAVMRSQAESAEGRAWVDAMLTIKRQKDRLEQAYAELRREESLRSALMQMIVHDLKNPLTAIMPWLQMIQAGGLTEEESREFLQTAIDECRTLLRMIEDLNDVGRMQVGGTLELEREPLDLRAMVQDVGRRMRARAAEAGMTLRVDVAEELPRVIGDRERLRRVLENLVANAIKYGRPPEDSGRPAEIWIAATPELRPPEAGGPSVRVEVRDFGPGIPPAEADRIFEPYYQAEAGRKRRAGVGLGLAFCRLVVEAHGGAIWTQPNPAGGSIFAFRLPAAPVMPEGNGAPAIEEVRARC